MIATLHLLATHHIASVEVRCESHFTFGYFEVKCCSLGVHVSKLLSSEVAHDALHLLSQSFWGIVSRIFFAFRQIVFLHSRRL